MEDIQTQLDQCKLLLDRAEVGLWKPILFKEVISVPII